MYKNKIVQNLNFIKTTVIYYYIQSGIYHVFGTCVYITFASPSRCTQGNVRLMFAQIIHDFNSTSCVWASDMAHI